MYKITREIYKKTAVRLDSRNISEVMGYIEESMPGSQILISSFLDGKGIVGLLPNVSVVGIHGKDIKGHISSTSLFKNTSIINYNATKSIQNRDFELANEYPPGHRIKQYLSLKKEKSLSLDLNTYEKQIMKYSRVVVGGGDNHKFTDNDYIFQKNSIDLLDINSEYNSENVSIIYST